MCEFIIGPNVYPGYGCCHCHVYNGLQRLGCKSCGAEHCALTVPDDLPAVHYHEDGGITEVEVLAVNADANRVEYKLRAIRSLQASPLVGDIEAGEEWEPMVMHNAGAYGGMWWLQASPRGTRAAGGKETR